MPHKTMGTGYLQVIRLICSAAQKANITDSNYKILFKFTLQLIYTYAKTLLQFQCVICVAVHYMSKLTVA